MADSVKQVIEAAGFRLAAVTDAPYVDAQVLAGYVLRRDRAWLVAHSDEVFPSDRLNEFRLLIDDRAQGRPVAHLTGHREFWSLRLKVTPDTLIPRPETEHLVEQVLSLNLPEVADVLDFGTGGGAIAIALAHERPVWRIHAMDMSAAALQVAAENAFLTDTSHICFVNADSLAVYGVRCFDVIVSNPPYIAEGDPHLRRGDIRFESDDALLAGEDGLDCIRYLVAHAPQSLRPGGWLLMEHGHDQAAAVRSLLRQAGYTDIGMIADLAGNDRVIQARYPDND